MLTNKPNEGDLTFGAGPNGVNTVFVDRPKNLKLTHPFYEKNAIEEINKGQKSFFINQYSFRAVVRKYSIKLKPIYFDHTDRPRYSHKFIQWFLNNLKHKNWLENIVKNV